MMRCSVVGLIPASSSSLPPPQLFREPARDKPGNVAVNGVARPFPVGSIHRSSAGTASELGTWSWFLEGLLLL